MLNVNLQHEESSTLLQTTVRFLISVFVLLVVWFVVVRLPGMDYEIAYDYPVSIGEIATAIIVTIIMLALLRCGRESTESLQKLLPDYADKLVAIKKVTIVVTMIIGYLAYESLIVPLFEMIDIPWLYPVLLLIVLAYYLYELSMLLMTDSGALTDLFKKAKPALTESKTEKTEKLVECPNCHEQVPARKFCTECGTELKGLAQAEQTAVGPDFCDCGAQINEGANFCVECGLPISRGSAAATKTAETE